MGGRLEFYFEVNILILSTKRDWEEEEREAERYPASNRIEQDRTYNVRPPQ